MKSRHVNRIFLAVILVHIAVVMGLMIFAPSGEIGIVPNFLISQGVLLLPVMAGAVMAGENPFRFAGFCRMRISTVWIIVLFTCLCMPLTTVVNIFTLFFVDNTVAAMSGEILELPFAVPLLIVGILGPLSEELVFRGIFYQGYKRSGSMLSAAFLSAGLFGLAHMNLNQAAYAFVIGLILALLVEAAGSLWSAVVFHVVFNSSQVALMYLSGSLMGEEAQMEQSALTPDILMIVLSVWLVVAAITTALASCVLVWIAKNEKREDALVAVWRDRKEKRDPLVTVPLLAGIVLACFYMGLLIVIPYALSA